MTKRLLEAIRKGLASAQILRRTIPPRPAMIGVALAILLIITLIGARNEYVDLVPFPAVDIYSNVDGTIKEISSIGEYVGPADAPGGAAYIIESKATQKALEYSKNELAALIALLPSKYSAAIPPSWLGWGESELDYAKPILADEISSINQTSRHKNLNLRDFIQSPKDKLTLFEISLFESNPKYAFFDRSLFRQALVDVAWEHFLTSNLFDENDSCGELKFCSTKRTGEELPLPLIEDTIFDNKGIASISIESKLSVLQEIDVCGDYVERLNIIAEEVKEISSPKTIPKSGYFNELAANPQHIDELKNECKELNSKLKAYLNFTLAVRKSALAPKDGELKNQLIAETKANLKMSEEAALKFADAIASNATHISAYAKPPGQLTVEGRSLLAAYRPKFKFTGGFFSVRERDLPITYLGPGMVSIDNHWVEQEKHNLKLYTSRASTDLKAQLSRAFSAKLNQITRQGITELEIAARQAYDVTDSIELLNWSRTQAISREARRSEIYSDIIETIVKLASERQSLLNFYSKGKQHTNEALKIEANWVTPGDIVKQGTKVLSGTPVFRWITKGNTPIFDRNPTIGDIYLVKVVDVPSIPLPPQMREIVGKLSNDAQDLLLNSLKREIAKNRTYRMTIREVTHGLLRHRYIGWIEDTGMPYVNISEIRSINADHANEIVKSFANTHYLAEFGNTILLYMPAGTLDPEHSYSFVRL